MRAILATALFVIGCSSSTASTDADTTPPPAPPAPAPTTPSPPAAPDACATFADDLRIGIEAVRAKQNVQHATVAVSTARCGDTVVFVDAPNAKTKVSADDLWQVGSVTKTFVAATVLGFANEGALSIDDALAKYLPDFPNAANITLRHLLSHTSGIFDYLQAGELGTKISLSPGDPIGADELIAAAAKHPPVFEPGKGWGYSNTNFVILGRIVEKVTGSDLGAAIRRGAIAKAGLSHAFFASTEKVDGTLVPGFQGAVDVTKIYHPSLWGAAGAMQTSAGDLLAWAKALYASDRVLDGATRAKMETTVTTDNASYRYGLGMMELAATKTSGNGIGRGHLGSVPGYMTEMFHHEDTKLTIVAIVSDSEGKPHDLTAVAYAKAKTLE